MTFRKPDLVELADEKVSIVSVCRSIGMSVPDDTSRRKLHCPFGHLYHSDGGTDPAFRIYEDSNSAYCFNCSTYFTPVTLIARAKGLRARDAARLLLAEQGLADNYALDWSVVSTQQVARPDTSMLAEALKIYCQRIDRNWSTRQFDPEIAAKLTRCLSTLVMVQDENAANLWLTVCKEAMRRELHLPKP